MYINIDICMDVCVTVVILLTIFALHNILSYIDYFIYGKFITYKI